MLTIGLRHTGFNSSGGAVRQYYIAAEKVLWDFAPLGGNACSGTVRPFNAYGAAHAVRNASLHQIGSKRWRAHYVEYTDATFTQRKVLIHWPRGPTSVQKNMIRTYSARVPHRWKYMKTV